MLGWIIGIFVDPIKIIFMVAFVFRPISWILAFLTAVLVGLLVSYIRSINFLSGSFQEWLPSNMLVSLLMIGMGNYFGRKRIKNAGDQN